MVRRIPTVGRKRRVTSHTRPVKPLDPLGGMPEPIKGDPEAATVWTQTIAAVAPGHLLAQAFHRVRDNACQFSPWQDPLLD